VRAEIILVGDELLEDMHGVQPDYMGELLQEMGADLAERGHILGRLTLVGDAPGELAPLLTDAAERRVDLVVTVGGLGPTHDDRVRDDVAQVVDMGPPRPHVDAMRWLVERYETLGIPVPEPGGHWERMGHCPPGVDPVRNPSGMAAGLAFRLGEGTEFRCLPGVTFEALPMWRQEVLPDLDRQGGPPPDTARAVLRVTGAREGIVGPVVEEFAMGRPAIRARINLMEAEGNRFGSIRVTITGGPDEVEVAADELVNLLTRVSGIHVDRGEADP
jgi:molybdopterin-biosynthesis enzyme MoeA-like protein